MVNFGFILKNNVISLAYIIICILFSLPFFTSVFTSVFSQDFPSGFDNANHAFFIKMILSSGDPLIQYSSYSDLLEQDEGRYYPSLMHNLVAIFALAFEYTSPIGVITALNTFILLVSISGAIGFSLLIREILKISIFKSYKVKFGKKDLRSQIYFHLLCILAFGILIFSTSLLIKTINDGAYAEVFAMWAIFPFYMIFLVRNNWIKSGILLSIIAASHNLSLIMILAITIAYLTSLVINRNWNLIKRSIILFITFGILSVPSFIWFYIPSIQGVVNNSAGNLSALTQDIILMLLSPFIYYSAIAVSIILPLLNYKRLSWLSIWIMLNFILVSFFPIVSSRVLRESSIAFSMIIGICLAYSIHILLTSGKLRKFQPKNYIIFKENNFKIVTLILVITIILPIYFYSQYERTVSLSDSGTTYYYSEAQGDSFQYLLSLHSQQDNSHDILEKDIILVYGYSPWLKTMLFDQYTVYESMARDYGDQLSMKDKEVNEEFLQIIKNPSSIHSACTLKKYGIDYLYIADNLMNRFYTIHQLTVFYGELDLLRFTTSPFLDLIEEFQGEGQEQIRIYSVDNMYVQNNC